MDSLADVHVDPSLVTAAKSGQLDKVDDVIQLAISLARQGQSTRAEILVQDLLASLEGIRFSVDQRIDPNAVALTLFGLGVVYQTAERYEMAEDTFLSAASESHDDGLRLAAQANRAAALVAAGVVAEDIRIQFAEILDATYDVPTLGRTKLLSLGLLRRVAGLIPAARECYDLVLPPADSVPSDPARSWDDKSFDALLALTGIEIDASNLPKAQRQLDKIALNYGLAKMAEPRFLLVKADLEIAKKDWVAAKRDLERARASLSASAEIAYRMGFIAVSEKKTDEAGRYFRRAIALQPGHALAISGLVSLQIGAVAEPSTEPFPGTIMRPVIGISLVLVAALLLVYAALPIRLHERVAGIATEKETTTELVCPAAVTAEKECPVPKTTVAVKQTVKETPEEKDRLAPISSAYLGIAAALAAVGFASIFWGKFKKLELGPLSLELEAATPSPQPVTSPQS